MNDMIETMPDIDEQAILSDPDGVKAKIAGEHPEFPKAQENIYTLPRGLFKNGTWNTEVEVRELTGVDEEILSRQSDARSFFDAVIGLGTARIGSVDLLEEPLSARRELLDELLLGERSYLFLAISGATFGNDRDLEITCQMCGTEQETQLLLSEDFPLEVEEDGIKDNYEYTTRKGDTVVYRLMTGRDERLANENEKASETKKNDLALSCVILTVGDGVPVDMEAYLKHMGMKDRFSLLEDLKSHQPEVDMDLEIKCIGCGEGQHLPLQWGDLFRP